MRGERGGASLRLFNLVTQCNQTNMAKKIVALIGKGTGPKVHVGGRASIEVLGTDEGHLVGAKAFQPDGSHTAFVFRDGMHNSVVDCHFLQFSYDGPGRSLICNVHMEA
jgi:hypothetical protein